MFLVKPSNGLRSRHPFIAVTLNRPERHLTLIFVVLVAGKRVVHGDRGDLLPAAVLHPFDQAHLPLMLGACHWVHWVLEEGCNVE